MRIFWLKQTDTEALQDHWQNLLELAKECDVPEISSETILSKSLTSITDKKLRDQMLKGKDFDLAKVVKQIQQNTYNQKYKKNTIPEAPKIKSGKRNHRRTYTQKTSNRKL